MASWCTALTSSTSCDAPETRGAAPSDELPVSDWPWESPTRRPHCATVRNRHIGRPCIDGNPLTSPRPDRGSELDSEGVPMPSDHADPSHNAQTLGRRLHRFLIPVPKLQPPI